MLTITIYSIFFSGYWNAYKKLEPTKLWMQASKKSIVRVM